MRRSSVARPGQRRTNQTRRVTPPRTGLPVAPFAGDFDRVDLAGDEFAGDLDDLFEVSQRGRVDLRALVLLGQKLLRERLDVARLRERERLADRHPRTTLLHIMCVSGLFEGWSQGAAAPLGEFVDSLLL